MIPQRSFLSQLAGVATWAFMLNWSLFYWNEPLTDQDFCRKNFGLTQIGDNCTKGIVFLQWGILIIPIFIGLVVYSIILKSKKLSKK